MSGCTAAQASLLPHTPLLATPTNCNQLADATMQRLSVQASRPQSRARCRRLAHTHPRALLPTHISAVPGSCTATPAAPTKVREGTRRRAERCARRNDQRHLLALPALCGAARGLRRSCLLCTHNSGRRLGTALKLSPAQAGRHAQCPHAVIQSKQLRAQCPMLMRSVPMRGVWLTGRPAATPGPATHRLPLRPGWHWPSRHRCLRGRLTQTPPAGPLA